MLSLYAFLQPACLLLEIKVLDMRLHKLLETFIPPKIAQK